MADGSSGGALRFGLLGPVRAFRGADVVDLGPVKQQAVLAVLLLNAGTTVPIQQIVAALWDGDPPENGIDVVQRCIGGLRRALGPSLLTFTDGGYVLRVDQNSVDTGMFRAALAQAHSEFRTGNIHTATIAVRDALDMWQDEPLAGLTGAFFQQARERLNSERTSASSLLNVPSGGLFAQNPGANRPVPGSSAGRSRPPGENVRRLPGAGNNRAPALDPTRVDTGTDEPCYPEPVDPWGDHALFPPDPTAMT